MDGCSELEHIYARHSPGVYRRALQLLGDREAARDATHDVFIRMLRGGGNVPAEHTPSAWLYRVTTNLCLNRLRDRNRQSAALAAKFVAKTAVAPLGETRAAVLQLLRDVPAELLEVAVYFFVAELTYDEIAPLIGASRRTVSNRLAAFRELFAVEPARDGESGA